LFDRVAVRPGDEAFFVINLILTILLAPQGNREFEVSKIYAHDVFSFMWESQPGVANYLSKYFPGALAELP
jgi:hypothetical protein